MKKNKKENHIPTSLNASLKKYYIPKKFTTYMTVFYSLKVDGDRKMVVWSRHSIPLVFYYYPL